MVNNSFLHVGVCSKYFTGRCFLRGPKRKDLARNQDCRKWSITFNQQCRHRMPVRNPGISISLDLKKYMGANDLQQTPTWSELSSAGYRHMIPISYTLGKSVGATVGQKFVANDDCLYYLQHICHAYIEGRIKFSSFEGLLLSLSYLCVLSKGFFRYLT
jgi:hypothetical protein